MLLPGALVFLLGYSYTKRFTWLSHFILGFTDGLAPMGAWVAVRGSLFAPADWPAWLLLAAVTLWIGGFDLIYACQDVEFDRTAGLHAIPARFGIAVAGLSTRVVACWPCWGAGMGWPALLAGVGRDCRLLSTNIAWCVPTTSRGSMWLLQREWLHQLTFMRVLGALGWDEERRMKNPGKQTLAQGMRLLGLVLLTAAGCARRSEGAVTLRTASFNSDLPLYVAESGATSRRRTLQTDADAGRRGRRDRCSRPGKPTAS